MNPYVGNELQVAGVEEYQLCGGKGAGMRIFSVTNGKGMEMQISPDRNGDITRLRCHGINLSYMSPCGYVAPAYYDNIGINWLGSFTAGFLTTCGLESVGSPCEDQGEILSLHGSIANQPCAHAYWIENDDAFVIHSVTKDETLFGRKLRITREITISKEENAFTLFDTIQNTGDKEEPLEVLYHMNMGYPLLDEDSQLTIPSIAVTPRDAHAAEDMENWMHMEKPQMGYQERCYYHRFGDAYGVAEIYQPKKNIGLRITFDAEQLDGFVEWKMMGYRDYVLGLECGNCYPDGRNIMRQTGMLKFIQPGEEKHYRVHVKII